MVNQGLGYVLVPNPQPAGRDHRRPRRIAAQPEHGQVPAARLLTRQALWGEGGEAPDPRASLAPLGRLEVERDVEMLRAEHIVRRGKVADVSFSVFRGEILGLYGLVGAGRCILRWRAT